MPDGTLGQTDHTALSDRAYDLLRARIADMTLKPGQHLSATHIAAELGFSTTPVREALNRLGVDGLVEASPYHGFDVSPLLSLGELRDLLHARERIELAVADLDGGLPPLDTAIPKLASLVDKMSDLSHADALDAVEFNSSDAEFHHTLVALSGNRFLLRAYETLHVHTQILRCYQRRSIREACQANTEHALIVDALGERSPERVAQAISAHIDGVLDRLESSAKVDH